MRCWRTAATIGLLCPLLSAAQDRAAAVELRLGQETKHTITGTRYTGDRFGGLAVLVTDELERPVPGASVTFTVVSPSGAGAHFEKDASTFVATTGDDGVAVTTGLRANGSAGLYSIRARASFDRKEGSVEFPQANNPRPLVKNRKTYIAGAAVAAVLIPVLALRSPPPKATISTVTPTGPVGSP